MPRIFSGVQPTAEIPHIGNYSGAFRQWVALQESYEAFYCVVDLHAMTVKWDPHSLRQQTRQTAAALLACGVDPDRSVVFVQSDVPQHTELTWILTCVSRMGELGRMTQFKEKSRGGEGTGSSSVGAGLFLYPVLMAADVLSYRADTVPVGEDQRQHLELMRDLAERFNRMFGETFPVPEATIPTSGQRIMALDDPTQKMSASSERPTGNLWMDDPPDVIRTKISRAMTDSGREIRYAEDKPAISNLLDIFSVAVDRPAKEIASEFDGKGYAELKGALADALIEFLTPFQERLTGFRSDPASLDAILDEGAGRAREVAARTLAEVRERVGLRS